MLCGGRRNAGEGTFRRFRRDSAGKSFGDKGGLKLAPRQRGRCLTGPHARPRPRSLSTPERRSDRSRKAARAGVAAKPCGAAGLFRMHADLSCMIPEQAYRPEESQRK
eukprot:scaffold1642_cov252-Pinguiococcus_pyrenoidosus.AAC.28